MEARQSGTVRSSSDVSLPVSGRNCKLSSSSLSMAAVDILYIDITRRWSSMALDQRDSGTWRLAATVPCRSSGRDGRYTSCFFSFRV